MKKLILIELKKVFHKKSIFILMIIMLLFNILNNVLFYTDYDESGNYKYSKQENITNQKKLMEEELAKYDYNNESDISLYVNLKTKLDIIKLQEKYSFDSWQYNKINDYLYNTIEDVNIYTYQFIDNALLEESQKKLSYLLTKFKEDDWKYFINIQIEELKNEQIELKAKINNIEDKKEKQNLEEIYQENELNLSILNYRIKNNIKDDNNYINIALDNYKKSFINLKKYADFQKLTYKEKIDYQNTKVILEESKYILKNKINYNKQNNLNYQLRTIVDDYEIFIIITILIIASTIVAEEFQTGTIKLLLIKPYSRGKILLSKYLTIIVVLLLLIIYLVTTQFIVGGLIFGLSSLKIPVIVYDLNKEIIIEYNIFIYMIIRIFTKIPLLLMLISMSFCLSTIINNIALSITIPLFIYIFTPNVNYLILQYKINPLKYLVNINWNFNNYLFGVLPEIEGMNFRFSIIIWSIYLIIIMIVAYLNFKKKNIRNV